MTAGSGFTLVELMVAVALGWLVLSGAIALHQTVSRAGAQSAALAELNDAARFALAYVETDLRQAGFLGLLGSPETIAGVAGPEAATTLAVGNDCGRNFAVNLVVPVDGRNNVYDLACRPYRSPQPGSDVLIVRRAAGITSVPAAGRLQVHTSLTGGGLSSDGQVPPELVAPVDTRDLVVSAYYVSRASSIGADVPGLRRKILRNGPRMVDEELMPGIEDLQIQFGVDLDPVGDPGRGSIDVWVNPEDARLASDGARIAAARVWLRAAAADAPAGYRAPLPAYADRTPPRDDERRRILVSRSYALRNSIAAGP